MCLWSHRRGAAAAGGGAGAGAAEEMLLPRFQALRGDAVAGWDSSSLQSFFSRAGTLVWPKDGLLWSGNPA